MITRKIHYYMPRGNGKRVCLRSGRNGFYQSTPIKENVSCRHCLIYMEAGKADVNMTRKEKTMIKLKLGSKGYGHGHRSKP